MLNFIGIGGYSNPDLGATSAYYKHEKKLVLVDCGDVVFRKLIEKEILKDVEELFIIITHLHDDHAGSLGSLIIYCFYNLKLKPTVIFPDVEYMNKYLEMVDIYESEFYNIHESLDLDWLKVKSFRQEHGNSIAFGYYINVNNKNIYYSGDGSKIDDDVVEKLANGEIDYFYQEVSMKDGNSHMYIEKLNQLIPKEIRSNVYCIHMESQTLIDKVKELGFNVPKI